LADRAVRKRFCFKGYKHDFKLQSATALVTTNMTVVEQPTKATVDKMIYNAFIT